MILKTKPWNDKIFTSDLQPMISQLSEKLTHKSVLAARSQTGKLLLTFQLLDNTSL